jgi:hypothetical protein
MDNGEGWESEWDRHADDERWFDEGEQLYENMLDRMIEDFGQDVMDQHAADMMFDGWFNPETDPITRAELWFDFFDYTGLDYDDFDWEAWREWYES